MTISLSHPKGEIREGLLYWRETYNLEILPHPLIIPLHTNTTHLKEKQDKCPIILFGE
jgi:hypothetical protein